MQVLLLLPLAPYTLADLKKLFLLLSDTDIADTEKAEQIINKNHEQDRLAGFHSPAGSILIDHLQDLSMQKGNDKDRIKSPCNGAFQTDDPLKVTGLLVIIPPDLSENAPHKDTHQIFK